MSEGRFIRIPSDPMSVTTIAENEEAPASGGLSSGAVEKIWNAIIRFYRSGVQPGMALCIRRAGHIVINRTIGHARGNGPDDNLKGDEFADAEKLLPSTPVCLFSASKAVTAMLVHLLHERHELNIHNPVANYIPEFARNGKEKITVEQILSHRAKISSFRAPINDEQVFDSSYLLEILYNQKQDPDPTELPAYHASTGGYILGEIIRRITGKDIRDLFEKEIARPLKLKTMRYGFPVKKIGTIAANYFTGPPINFPLSAIIDQALGGSFDRIVDLSMRPGFYNHSIPSVNMVSTAEETCRFFELLLRGGSLDGREIFHRRTVEDAVKVTANAWFDRGLMLPMRYSNGFMLGNSPIGLYGPESLRAFGHLGFINTLCWADPDRDISVAFIATGKALVGFHLLDFANLINTIATETAAGGRVSPK